MYDNPVLGMWAWKVRKDYRNNKLAQWKIDKLEGLEFLWKVDQVTSKWHTNLHECRRYKVGVLEASSCKANLSAAPSSALYRIPTIFGRSLLAGLYDTPNLTANGRHIAVVRRREGSILSCWLLRHVHNLLCNGSMAGKAEGTTDNSHQNNTHHNSGWMNDNKTVARLGIEDQIISSVDAHED